MMILLALLTFLVCVTLDYLLHYRNAEQTVPEAVPLPQPAAEPSIVSEPVYVGGYELPDGLHYHRGHTWAKVISPDTAVVGVDDFAGRLLGRVDAVKPPRVGAWLRQGVRCAIFEGEARRSADVVAPLEGEVIAVNRDLAREPDAVREDPYGRGWLFKIRTSNLGTNVRNLLDGSLAQRWTEDAREQLEFRLMALSGSVLQDGGAPAPDFADHLETAEWRDLVHTFLLT